MCESCGCEHSENTHTHGEHHHHTHKKIDINIGVMDKNNLYANKNREFFEKRNILAINLISSPGSGKTSLLEEMAKKFGDKMAVIVGDLQTQRDAERIIGAGSRAHQIETGGACHLDAHGISHALTNLNLENVKLVIIENVGNLVCPASYDLGESLKVAILSTPEGDDKVLKYPSIFNKISTLIINKIDLLPYLDFNITKAVNECKSLNCDFNTFNVSTKNSESLDEFFKYIEQRFLN